MRRILSIDGGGIKGVFPAAFLAELEHRVGPIGRYFDLICGTSTGGIIALGLAAGFRAGEVLELYRQHGKEIFPRIRRYNPLTRLFTPKYDPAPLRRALSECFGDLTLDDCRARLVVPSQHFENGEIYVYKTAHHPDLMTDGPRRLVDVALATSAAPTYFPSHLVAGGAALLDGGLWANNPAGVAAVEAIGKLGWIKGDVAMLSLGCTEEPLDARRLKSMNQSLAAWATKICAFFMAGQSSGAIGTARLLLSGKNVLRCSPIVAPGTFALDRLDAIGQLARLGHVEARKASPEVTKRFLYGPAEPFVAEKANRVGAKAEGGRPGST